MCGHCGSAVCLALITTRDAPTGSAPALRSQWLHHTDVTLVFFPILSLHLVLESSDQPDKMSTDHSVFFLFSRIRPSLGKEHLHRLRPKTYPNVQSVDLEETRQTECNQTRVGVISLHVRIHEHNSERVPRWSRETRAQRGFEADSHVWSMFFPSGWALLTKNPTNPSVLHYLFHLHGLRFQLWLAPQGWRQTTESHNGQSWKVSIKKVFSCK